MIRLEDETLKCDDCGGRFVFTAGERGLLLARGRDELPTRCPPCQRRLGHATRRARDPLMSPDGGA